MSPLSVGSFSGEAAAEIINTPIDHVDAAGAAKKKRRSTVVREADVADMIALLAAASNPPVDIPPIERKRRLFEGISRLIGATTWVWVIGRADPQDAGNAIAVSEIDGGWRDDRERLAAIRAIGDVEYQRIFYDLVRQALAEQSGFTRLRSEILSDELWHASLGAKHWSAAGLDHFVMSLKPLENGAYSTTGFHRRIGEPAFSRRDRAIVDLLFQNTDWLHRPENCASSLAGLATLTPRERQVLSLLLEGAARKEVATRLMLSGHTINDHLKEIYRKLRVSSRAELLSKFIPTAENRS